MSHSRSPAWFKNWRRGCLASCETPGFASPPHDGFALSRSTLRGEHRQRLRAPLQTSCVLDSCWTPSCRRGKRNLIADRAWPAEIEALSELTPERGQRARLLLPPDPPGDPAYPPRPPDPRY